MSKEKRKINPKVDIRLEMLSMTKIGLDFFNNGKWVEIYGISLRGH